MIEAHSPEVFLRNPVGRWVAVGTSIVWCHSPALCGSAGWGKPRAEDTAAVLRVFEAFRHPAIAPAFDVVLDGRALHVSAEGLHTVIAWLARWQDEVRRRVRLQIGILPPGVGALLLGGILPLLGQSQAHVFTEAPAAFRLATPDDGDELAARIDAIISAVRAEPRELRALDHLLRQHQGRLDVAEAARRLGTSTRTLQRILGDRHTSFRERQLHARFRAAADLLSTTDLKASAIAARIGISKSALAQLVRRHAGVTIVEYRRHPRERDASIVFDPGITSESLPRGPRESEGLDRHESPSG